MFGFSTVASEAQANSLSARAVAELRKDGSPPIAGSDLPPAENEEARSLPQDEFADRNKIILTRRIREADYNGIPVVILEIPSAAGDGFDEISVDKATELARTILRICQDGSICRLAVVMEGNTLARIYSVRPVRP